MKTDDDIQKERDAVQKMVGAKSAMETAIKRIERLEGALKKIGHIAGDLGKRVGEDLYIKTYFHDDRTGESAKIVTVRSQIEQISELVRCLTK